MQLASKLKAGSVISMCRVAVALAMLATSITDIGALPVRNDTMLVMVGYLAASAILLAVSRINWWLDHHLAKPAFAIDFVIAFWLLYLNEVSVTGAVSPFMAFFIFLLLSATLQWKAKGLLTVALLCLGGYLLMDLALQAGGQASDNPWFIRRLIFMIAIGAFVAWFGLQSQRPQAERLDWPLDAGLEEQFATIAEYMRAQIGATGLALAWSPIEEPWTTVFRAGSLGDELRRTGPEADLSNGTDSVDAILFDLDRERALQLTREGQVKAFKGKVAITLAEELAVPSAIAVPIRSEIGKGMMLLAGIPAVSGDHLRSAKLLADELGYALDRHEMVLLMQHQEAIRLRADFARDLHDSVAQSLAGSEFRLGALRHSYAAGKDISADLAAIQESLGREAEHVQAMIADLRRQEPQARVVNAGEDLRRALEEAANRWGIACQSTTSGNLSNLRKWLVREMQHMIREAVANAVRHAGAGSVSLSVEGRDGILAVHITNDGSDFPEDWLGEMPQSIAERVDELGGKLEIDRTGGLTRLSILLPTGHG